MSDLTRTQTCWHTFQCVVRITKNEKKIKTITQNRSDLPTGIFQRI